MKKFLSLLSALICSTAVSAAPMSVPSSAEPAMALPQPDTSQVSPVDRLRIGVESLTAFMNQEPIPAPSAVSRYLDENVAPLFDFDAMARASGGRYYHRLSEEQKSAMADEIKRLFLTRLTLGLAAYDGQKVRFLPPRVSPDGSEAMISMLILNRGRYPARIDFRLAPERNGWRIIDLAANGTSAVVHYRRMLAEKMARLNYQRRQSYSRSRGWRQPSYLR